jgi:hypothetical protein
MAKNKTNILSNEDAMKELRDYITGNEGTKPFTHTQEEAISSAEGNEVGDFNDYESNDAYDYSFQDLVNDIDFSEFKGDLKSSLNKVKKRVKKDKHKIIIPSNRKVIIEGRKRMLTDAQRFAKRGHKNTQSKKGFISPRNERRRGLRNAVNVHVNSNAKLGEGGKTKRIIIPSDRQIIIEGVDKFMLSKEQAADSLKNIFWHKGKKLKELVLLINNTDSAVDFTLELFNPTDSLNYLYNNSLNLDDKVSVSNSEVLYSEVLNYILANPTHIVNAQFDFNGANANAQLKQALFFRNKAITGELKIDPVQLQLLVDVYQYQPNQVSFNLNEQLNAPFIPDGMHTIKYTVLAGNNAALAFYYEQVVLKKFFYEEADKSKILL